MSEFLPIFVLKEKRKQPMTKAELDFNTRVPSLLAQLNHNAERIASALEKIASAIESAQNQKSATKETK